ncbi:MAG: helix-turn-helix domain-containing protein [Cyanobacteria bacterium J06638_20]
MDDLLLQKLTTAIEKSNALLEQAQDREDRLTAVLERQNELFEAWQKGEQVSDRIDKHEAAKLLNVHPGTLQRYRSEHWIEGIHYFSGAKITYSRLMILDWQENRYDPAAHLRMVELFAQQKQQRMRTMQRRSA